MNHYINMFLSNLDIIFIEIRMRFNTLASVGNSNNIFEFDIYILNL